VIIKQEQLIRLRESDGDIVPMKACNADGGKVITIITALGGNTYHAQQ